MSEMESDRVRAERVMTNISGGQGYWESAEKCLASEFAAIREPLEAEIARLRAATTSEPKIQDFILLPHIGCCGIFVGPFSAIRCNECGAEPDGIAGDVAKTKLEIVK